MQTLSGRDAGMVPGARCDPAGESGVPPHPGFSADWLDEVADGPSDVLVGMGATGHCRMALYAFLVSRGYRVAVIDPVQMRAARRLRGFDEVKSDRAEPPCSPYQACPTPPGPRSSPRSAT